MRIALLPKRPPAGDLVLGAAAAVIAAIGTIGANIGQDVATGPDAGMLVSGALAGGLLAWRRSAPLLALIGVVLVAAGYLAAGYAFGPVLLCVLLALFETARNTDRRVSLPACAAAAAAVVAVIALREAHGDSSWLFTAFAGAGWLIIPWTLGALARVRAKAAERDRRELAERARTAERMRVAGEVHDIAGHGFSAVAMQAGVALLVLDEDPAQVRRSLEAIQSTSTTALGELRTMLDTFHPDPSDRPRAPEPSAQDPAGLAELVDAVRAGGLRVDVDSAGLDRPLPADLGRLVHRVVREALTNVLRHADSPRAEVLVRREGAEVVVDVRDHGSATGTAREGRGLSGMRERVEAAGGTLVTGSGAGGGFRVTARIPAGEA
ncbi:sensor histidine kinase [Salinifilum ghardaiensis]